MADHRVMPAHAVGLGLCLIACVVLSCQNKPSEKTPHATNELEHIISSPDGTLFAQPRLEDLIVYIDVRQESSLHTLETYASHRMRWIVEWGQDNVLWFASSDVGTAYWIFVEGRWKRHSLFPKTTSYPPVPPGIKAFRKR